MLVRSLFAMNYLAFISSVSAVNRDTAFTVFTDQLAVLAVGTLSMTIASLKAAKLRAYTSGAVLGAMVATPLVAIIRQSLYFDYVGCTGVGAKSAMFPDGMPSGCDPDSQEFQLVFQGTKALTVFIVATFALLGTKTMGFSIAMMGATMIINGSLDLTKSILLTIVEDQAAGLQILRTMDTITLPVTYGIAGAGYFIQWMILKPKRDERNPDPYVLDPAIDKEKDVKMKTDYQEMLPGGSKDPYGQVGVVKFFKAVIKKQLLERKIKKSWWKNYRLEKEAAFVEGRPPPIMKKFAPPYMVPMDPATDECMKAVPFKFFRFLVGGKWDDRIAAADHFLSKLLLADEASDPKELQLMLKVEFTSMNT